MSDLNPKVMTTENLKILFVQAKSRVNSKNQSPLYCRLTLNGKRKQFSTGIYIESVDWEAKTQIILKSHKSAISYNSKLEKIRSKLNSIYTILILQENSFTIDNIYDAYLGKELKKSESTLSYYKLYLAKIKKLIGLEIKENTYNKFVYVCNHLETFLKWKYKKTEFPLEELTQQFLDDFEYYLKTEKKQQQITINKTIQRFRTPIKHAISEGYLDRDPFILYKTKTARKTFIFLTTEELKTLEETIINQKRLKFVQDLFVFCCYTGLAFNEMSNLEKKHIQIGFDNTNWIKMKREKTQRDISIPILPKAQIIINKYATTNSKIFPSLSNQKFNSYLKEISAIAGIEKNLTHHIARKTFASTILLYNDVPMEIVSELLGHSSMATTQESYAKVVQRRVSDEMKKLKGKFEKI
jgi:integrase